MGIGFAQVAFLAIKVLIDLIPKIMEIATMGASMIERAAAELGISEKTTNLLMHILLSHHGVPEFGSPRYPMFPEAEIVSEVDHLDAKMFTMYNVLDGVTEGEFSDRVWSLDNRQLYKHWTEETE